MTALGKEYRATANKWQSQDSNLAGWPQTQGLPTRWCLDANPGSTAAAVCDLKKAAKPQPAHLKNEEIKQDKWGDSGAAMVIRRTNGVLSTSSSAKKKKGFLSKSLADCNFCGVLATHDTAPTFWLQFPISTPSQASVTGSGPNQGCDARPRKISLLFLRGRGVWTWSCWAFWARANAREVMLRC